MERMGKMKIKDLCAQMDWQYQKFHRRLQANDFRPEDLELIVNSMNSIAKYHKPVTKYDLMGDPPLPDVLTINGVTYIKKKEQ